MLGLGFRVRVKIRVAVRMEYMYTYKGVHIYYSLKVMAYVKFRAKR